MIDGCYPLIGFNPISAEGLYIYLGEIPNMKDHCIILDYLSGQAIIGYHIDNFREAKEEDLD